MRPPRLPSRGDIRSSDSSKLIVVKTEQSYSTYSRGSRTIAGPPNGSLPLSSGGSLPNSICINRENQPDPVARSHELGRAQEDAQGTAVAQPRLHEPSNRPATPEVSGKKRPLQFEIMWRRFMIGSYIWRFEIEAKPALRTCAPLTVR